MCSHTILSAQGIDIPDAKADWRFHDSPFVQDGTIAAYYGQPLAVRNPLERDVPDHQRRTHAIGALCVMSRVPRHDGHFVDDNTRDVLRDLAAIISREFEAQAELRMADKDARMRALTADLLERSTVRTKDAMVKEDKELFDDLASFLRRILDHADWISLIDMRNTDVPIDEPALQVLGFDGDAAKTSREDHIEVITRVGEGEALARLVRFHREHGQGLFNTPEHVADSPLAPFLAPDTTCAISMPLFSPSGEFLFLIVAQSTQRAPCSRALVDTIGLTVYSLCHFFARRRPLCACASSPIAPDARLRRPRTGLRQDRRHHPHPRATHAGRYRQDGLCRQDIARAADVRAPICLLSHTRAESAQTPARPAVADRAHPRRLSARSLSRHRRPPRDRR
jgi:hypothetical protein